MSEARGTTPAVVYLEADDEITNAVARLRALEAPQVVIALPPGSRIATSRINFRLLAREARDLQRTLAIVSGDAAVRALAIAAGLPAHASVGESEAALAAGVSATPAGAPAADPRGVSPHGRTSGTVPTTLRPRSGGADAAEPPSDATRVMPTLVTAADHAGPRRPANQQPLPWTGDGDDPTADSDPHGPALGTTRRPSATVGGRGRPATAAATVRVDDTERHVPRRREIARGEPRGERRGRRRVTVLALLLLATFVAVAGASAYFLNPTARITLTPRTEPLGPMNIRIRADAEATQSDVRAGIVPAERIPLQLSATATFPATGVRVVMTKAEGSVRFTSENTFLDVSVPSGTKVSTANGVEFATTRDVVVPRARFGPPPKRGTVDAPVEAIEEGPGGNVSAGTIRRTEPSLGARLVSVDNPAPTSGGSRSETRLVSEKDVETAVRALGARLDEQMAAAVRDPANRPPGLRVFPETAERGEARSQPPAREIVDKPAERFELTLTATARVIGVDESQLPEIAAARLRQSVPEGRQLLDGSIRTRVGEPKVVQQRVTYVVEASAQQWKAPDIGALLASVKGRKLDDARGILEAYGAVEIELSPDLTGTLPNDEARLELTVTPPQTPST